MPRRLVKPDSGLVVLEPPLEIPGFTKTAAWHAHPSLCGGTSGRGAVVRVGAGRRGMDVE